MPNRTAHIEYQSSTTRSSALLTHSSFSPKSISQAPTAMAQSTGCVTSVGSLSSKEPDFIIIGGGIGGLVVANRLSEHADKNVLVIEAGAHRRGDPRIDTVGMLSTLYGDPNYDWDFMTEPQVCRHSITSRTQSDI